MKKLLLVLVMLSFVSVAFATQCFIGREAVVKSGAVVFYSKSAIMEYQMHRKSLNYLVEHLQAIKVEENTKVVVQQVEIDGLVWVINTSGTISGWVLRGDIICE